MFRVVGAAAVTQIGLRFAEPSELPGAQPTFTVGASVEAGRRLWPQSKFAPSSSMLAMAKKVRPSVDWNRDAEFSGTVNRKMPAAGTLTGVVPPVVMAFTVRAVAFGL